PWLRKRVESLWLGVGRHEVGAHVAPGPARPDSNESFVHYIPRATVQTQTSRAPASCKARAQALVVAPVVKTSSTMIMRLPSSWQPGRTAKARDTLAARCLRESSVWVRVA